MQATILCSLFVASMCSETGKATMKDTKLKRESSQSYGGSSGYSGGGGSGGHGGSGGLALAYGVPSSGGSSSGHQQISLAPISLDMLGGGHGLQYGGLNLDTSKLSGLGGGGGGGGGQYILDTSKLTSLLAGGGHGLSLDTSKLLSSGGGGGHGLSLDTSKLLSSGGGGHGLNFGSYGVPSGGSHSAGLVSAQALLGVGGSGDHGGAQSGVQQFGFALAPSGGHGSGYSFGGAEKQGPITFGHQGFQSPAGATYGVPAASYQIPSGSYGAPISSFGTQGHSFGGSFGSLGGSSHSGGQEAVPSYAVGIKGLGHYTSSSAVPLNSISSHFAQLSLPGGKYGAPLFTSAKSFGSTSGFNFAQQPAISSYRHTALPSFAGLTSGGALKSATSFRPSVFLGASQDSGADHSAYTSGGSSAYSLPSKSYLPASSGAYFPSSSYQFPSSSSSHSSFGSLGSSLGSSSSHSSLGSLGSLGGGGGGGSSYSFPSSSSSSSSSSHGGSLGGSSGDSYGSGSFDSHTNYNTIDYSSQH